MMIFVSAGHYEGRPGASYAGLTEHAEALVWQELMLAALGPIHSVRVLPGTLREKVKFVNQTASNADVAIEIHFNSLKVWQDLNKDGQMSDDELRATGRGSESLYYPGSVSGLRLAQICQGELGKIFPPDRGEKEGWYRMDPRRGPDFFLAQTRCPAVIVEPEFIHRGDVIQSRREEACESLARALREYDDG